MTKEELREHCKRQIRHCEIYAHDRGVEPSGNIYEEHKLILELLEQESSLDKIRAEIKEWYWQADKQALAKDPCVVDAMIDLFIRTIDKYKAAEELRMEKHTDRQIYDGCIHLMQKMVDYFQEYLEYLGYDLDKLDEDERFGVGISNMEIVRYLFLYHTRNSGGCSTRDFCKKLEVDPYKSVKFEFEESEEE